MDDPRTLLVYKGTKTPARVGDLLLTFRGERYILTGSQSPRHSASTGRIYARMEGYPAEQGDSFFPSVCGLEFIVPETVE